MRIRVLVLGVLAALGLCAPAGASTLVTRGATDIGLKADSIAGPDGTCHEH